MAAKWEDFQQNKDLYPNLKYITVGDKRVRPEHQAWEGLIKPIDDPWWSTHLPPNDWGCRCDVEPTDEAPTEWDPKDETIKEAFQNNAAKTGKIFLSEAYSVDLTNLEKDQASINSLVLLAKDSDATLKAYAEKLLYDLPRDKQFSVIYESSKGKVSEHILTQQGKDYKTITEVSKLFAKKGNNVELMPILNRKELQSFREKVFPNYDLLKNPDIRVNNTYYDIKEVESFSKIQRNANRAGKQGSVAVIKFEDESFSEVKMQQQAKRIFGDNNIDENGVHNYPFNEVYFYHKGKLYKYNRE